MIHDLRATPPTVHWGHFDPALPPVLTVASGDIVKIEAVTHHAGDAPDLLMDEGIARIFDDVDDRGKRYTFAPADGVPAPVAPYAHATASGALLCVTGQLGVDAGTGRLVGTAVAEQTDQVMRNLVRVLELCGAGLEQVMHARVYLTSMDRPARGPAVSGREGPAGDLDVSVGADQAVARP